jgi:pSer/pThr/pTyr-binding forkhead associated (FHA) protein
VEFEVDLGGGGPPRMSVRDLGSTNGMLVDGHRITHTRVHDGTTVKIGNTTMTVRVVEEGADV